MKEHQSKDESKNLVEEYQDAERRNDSRIFLPNLRNKRTVESDWRHHRRIRIRNNHPKWSRKTLGCLHPVSMRQKGETTVWKPMRRMHPRRDKGSQPWSTTSKGWWSSPSYSYKRRKEETLLQNGISSRITIIKQVQQSRISFKKFSEERTMQGTRSLIYTMLSLW